MSGRLMASYVTEKTVMTTEDTRLIAGFFWVSCFFVRFFFQIKYGCFCFFLRYTEEETTAAGKPAATGPAALSSAQRELSDGTDETLRDITLVLLCAFKGSTSFQRVTFIIEKFTELIKRYISQAKAESFFGDPSSLMNSAPGL